MATEEKRKSQSVYGAGDLQLSGNSLRARKVKKCIRRAAKRGNRPGPMSWLELRQDEQ